MTSEITEQYAVKVVSLRGTAQSGTFELWEANPNESDEVKLVLKLPTRIYEAVSTTYFEAMREIRLQLEAQGQFLHCYGASQDVYPSPMIMSMGAAEKAYRLTIGRPAKTADLVSIFDTAGDVVLSTVTEQEAFYDTWQKTQGRNSRLEDQIYTADLEPDEVIRAAIIMLRDLKNSIEGCAKILTMPDMTNDHEWAKEMILANCSALDVIIRELRSYVALRQDAKGSD